MAETNDEATKRLEGEQAERAIRFVAGILDAARVGGMAPAVLIAAMFEALGHLMCEDLCERNPAHVHVYLEFCQRLTEHVAKSLPSPSGGVH